MAPPYDEQQARKVAESARETTWQRDSFLRDLFHGKFTPGLLQPFPTPSRRPAFREFYEKLERILHEDVDPAEIDRTGEYPPEVVKKLADLGAFGMKIDTAHGGLGLTHLEYVETMRLVGSHDANVAALLSAHQAIGVPRPVAMFGTDEQKERFLPRCARGEISAFALTEPAVGSDPGTLTTEARPIEDGAAYELTGEKLWCTNGTLADLIVVMARNPETDRINAFVVEMDWPGVKVTHRCHFMGLRALANAHLTFDRVRIPAENRIGDEGAGLKVALATLNTGRLTLPAATAGGARRCLEIMRLWGRARVQWGVPIGEHEAVAHKIADAAAIGFAMDALAWLVGDMADRPDYDLRLEAAAAKEWNTVRLWSILDDTLQVRGGRGYETEASLRERGEVPIGVERMVRDARINLIFEGSSEIMHLFMAREAVDHHLQVAGTLVDPEASRADKLRALPGIAAHYAWWYPSLWLPRGTFFRYRGFGDLGRHLRFVERRGRKLARQIFHGMVVHGPGLEKKQGFLFRVVDIAMELFAMAAVVVRADAMDRADDPNAKQGRQLAETFCAGARRRVDRRFQDLWANEDVARYSLARSVLDGDHLFLEGGLVPSGVREADLVPEPAVVDGASSPAPGDREVRPTG